MIQTIVFAADMSVYTPYVVQHVIALAKDCDATVVAVHAVEPLGFLGNAVISTYLPQEISKDLQEGEHGVVLSNIKDQLIDLLADEFLDGQLEGQTQVKTARELSDVEVIVEPGRPADIILKHAHERQADLIVMGSHSPDVVHGYGLGSVTNKVLQLSKIPVFTVPMLPQSPSSLDLSDLPRQHPLF
ncbi:MAG: universal stress protein [Cellvibrionaceae bacterium]